MLELCSITWQISIALLRYFCLLVLFVCGFTSLSTIFHSYGEVTSTGERLQMLTYAWYSWQLLSEGSLSIHTYSDMGYPFIMVIHQDPYDTHTCCRSFVSGDATTFFNDLKLPRPGIDSRSFTCEAKTLPLNHRGG